MRRITLATAVIALIGALVAPASGGPPTVVKLDLGAGAFISDNVTYVGTIPIEAIGGRMVKVGTQTRFYVTGAPGLVIYDVTNPALPVPLGSYPLPHFQNEDVDVSDDGARVIISTDTASVDRTSGAANGIHVFDTTNPADIRKVGFHANGNHTTTCADPKCEWLYGSGGTAFDARNPADIKVVGAWKTGGTGGGHALNRDAAGLLISDSDPRFVLDPRQNPAKPLMLAKGSVASKFRPDGLLQHNNVRPDADKWVPRDPLTDPNYADPAMRPGELLVGNSESNVRTQCGGNAGGLSSWSMVNFDQTKTITQIESFRPVNGTWANGNPAVNALGCSGHWFTVRNNMIAAGWYEHGIRFIAIDPATGKFTERGFFQPVTTEAGSAHWVTAANGDEYVYSTDYARGIDILKFTRTEEAPSRAEITESWLAKLNVVGARAEGERYLCNLAARSAENQGTNETTNLLVPTEL